MATITFDKASAELAQTRVATNPSPLDPIDNGGRIRVKRFSYVADGTETAGTQIEIGEFLKEKVILGGAITDISLSNSATADIGWTLTATPVDDNVNVFVDGATAPAVFTPYMLETTAKTTLFITTAVGTLAANDTVSGYILYVENS